MARYVKQLVRRRWRIVCCVGLVVVGLVVWGLWPTGAQRYVPDPRSRQFSQFTVCVLTDGQGVTGIAAAPVWAGVVDAAKATRAQGSYLSVPSPGSQAAAELYVNTLALRQCGVVVAVGGDEVAAVSARASAYSGERFVVVGGSQAAVNVAVVSSGAPAVVERAVAAVLERAAAGQFSGGAVS